MKKTLITSLLSLGALLTLNAQEVVSYVPEPEPYVEVTYPSFRIAVQAGMGFRLGELPSTLGGEERAYYKGLLKGFSFGLDATYFLDSSWGIGIKFNNLHSGKQLENATFDMDGHQMTGKMADQIDIWFLGPLVSGRGFSKSLKVSYYGAIGLGCLGYNQIMTRISSAQLSGATIGRLAEIGADFYVTDHLSIGATANLLTGALSRMKVSVGSESRTVSLSKDERENLSQVNVQIGLRYTF